MRQDANVYTVQGLRARSWRDTPKSAGLRSPGLLASVSRAASAHEF